ncbi:MAG: hypothetical protein HYT87_13250 [Nitrospirae bacterium]|nr:hypothetical protein [Nitrospirota bacterium]
MTIEERLSKLEHELDLTKRRNRWLWFALFPVIVGCALAWPSEKAGKVIRASKFVLEDKWGHDLGALGVTEAGPVLAFWDEKGTPRAQLIGS